MVQRKQLNFFLPRRTGQTERWAFKIETITSTITMAMALGKSYDENSPLIALVQYKKTGKETSEIHEHGLRYNNL
jgi:hypothetical protein